MKNWVEKAPALWRRPWRMCCDACASVCRFAAFLAKWLMGLDGKKALQEIFVLSLYSQFGKIALP